MEKLRICNIDGCGVKHSAHGLCKRHDAARRRASKEGRIYHAWYSMRWRCNRTSGYYFKYYKGSGIGVCDRWRLLENFLEDMGHPPTGMTIERIDNTKGYTPDNCRWATMKEQCQNKRNNRFVSIDGTTKTLAQWVDLTGKPSIRTYLRVYGEAEFIARVKSLLAKTSVQH